MADTLQFDLVSPERSLASFAATEVHIPGSEGDMTAMADHAPILTTLRPGVLSASGSDGDQQYVVTGGFAEVTATGVTVLAERAIPLNDFNRSHLDELIADAEEAHKDLEGHAQDASGRSLAVLHALADTISV